MKKVVLFITVALLFCALVPSKARAQSPTLTIKTTFKWEAMTGELEGYSFRAVDEEKDSREAGADDGDLYYIVNFTQTLKLTKFNAKVWRDQYDIAALAIVSPRIDDKGNLVIADDCFRFDQASDKEKEKFKIVNESTETLYVKIGSEEVMLNPGDKSGPLEAHQGWYYLEISYKTDDGEVMPWDVVISVASRQRHIQIRKGMLP